VAAAVTIPDTAIPTTILVVRERHSICPRELYINTDGECSMGLLREVSLADLYKLFMDILSRPYAFESSFRNRGEEVITSMRSIAIPGTVVRDASRESDLMRRRRRWGTFLTASGSMAVVTGLFGVVFAVVALLDIVPHFGRISRMANVMLVLTFPILIFAAHCLDKIDEINAAIREHNFRSKEKK
jgi:hypothetical protein